MAVNVPSVELNNGVKMPIFGLGTWRSQPGEVTQAVKDAIDVGYRHIDGAMLYQNEPEVGAGINAKINDGTVKREDLFVVSKLWNTCHNPESVVPSLKRTLSDLKLDYVDLYLIHWPVAFKEGSDLLPKDENGQYLFNDVDYVDTYKAMEECVRLGLTKSIGVSNFNSKQIERVLENCSIKPVMNQVECHPYLSQKKLQDFCEARNILITAYSPLGAPARSSAKPTDPKLLEDPKLLTLAKKYNKSPAQILLRWLTQRNVIVIPKTVNKSRLVENISIFDFKLDSEDMDYIATFDCNGRQCKPDWAEGHKYNPFSIEY